MNRSVIVAAAIPLVMSACIMTPQKVVVVCDCATSAPTPAPQERRIVPLCPAIAEVSFPDAKQDGALVNHFVIKEAARQKVNVEVVSGFTARISGRRNRVEAMIAGYPSLLCSFNQSLKPNGQSTYTSCMAHAKEWMDIVQNSPGELMLSHTLFRENCTTPG
ncbi:hypothetical protein HCG46_17515 [Labrenzia sp. PO1]|uniref:hypothetical protein n=1 Tax=Labrenzia sp. PO1 TaxID=2720390 RepID=UPI001446D929|nr:hypothetical protein [Labrenzia sp. PO1]NKI60066.1 hypothetical protein [Labrenzia sp. PO1]